MDLKSKWALLVAILMGLGGWILAAQTWHSLTTPQAVGGLLLILGGALRAAFGVLPPDRT